MDHHHYHHFPCAIPWVVGIVLFCMLAGMIDSQLTEELKKIENKEKEKATC